MAEVGKSRIALRKAITFAAAQHDVITYRQARACGMSHVAVSRMHRAGWFRFLPGVYIVSIAGLKQQLMAAQLWAGPGAVISHRSAGLVWRFDGLEEEVVELTIPRAWGIRSPHLTVHRADLTPEDHCEREGFRVTTPLRTLIDLSSSLGPRSLALAVEHAWRERMVTPARLRKRLEELGTQGRPGAALLDQVLADCEARERPHESPLEVKLWWMIREAGLPMPLPQHVVHDGGPGAMRLDFAYPGQGLALEADSMQFHGEKQYFLAHCERLTRLAAAGWRVMHFTKSALYDEARVVALVRAGLSRTLP